MPRSFCIPGIFFLLCAFVLLVLTSISLPFLTAFDITRVHFDTHNSAVFPNVGTGSSINQLRLGVWAYCADSSTNGDRTCSPTGHAYAVTVDSGVTNGGEIVIKSAWTRGLLVTPVAAGVTFLALLSPSPPTSPSRSSPPFSPSSPRSSRSSPSPSTSRSTRSRRTRWGTSPRPARTLSPALASGSPSSRSSSSSSLGAPSASDAGVTACRAPPPTPCPAPMAPAAPASWAASAATRSKQLPYA